MLKKLEGISTWLTCLCLLRLLLGFWLLLLIGFWCEVSILSEKIFISFVYEEENEFVLVVPDIKDFKVRDKRQSQLISKAINNLEKNFSDKLGNIVPNPIEYFMNDHIKRNIPNGAILYPLPIKTAK